MMCDTNWCTFCDNAISPYSDSLYCSDECLRQDALLHHPMLGYDYADLRGFPHVGTDICSKRKSSTPSVDSEPIRPYFCQLNKSPSLSPSLSSSLSSSSSQEDHDHFTTTFYQPKPRRATPIHFMEHSNQAMLRS